jgi:hypothetical protein
MGGFGPELRRFIAASHFQGQVNSERLMALLNGMGLEISKRQRRLAGHPRVVIAKAAQVPVDCGGRQPTWRQLPKAVGHIDTMLHQHLQSAHRREMAAILVDGPHVHGGGDLAPALDLASRHGSGKAPIGSVRVLWRRSPRTRRSSVAR